MRPTALFIGAHPDDLEIAAAGTIAKLRSKDWNVLLIVMTDDSDPEQAKIRRVEATTAGAALGVHEDRIVFLGLPDGHLKCTPEIVHLLRSTLATHDLKPSLVFTHIVADDHQDHRATHEIVCAAIREVPRLYFPVVNHLVPSDFHPVAFIDVESNWPAKLKALRAHATQGRRISEPNISALASSFQNQSGLQMCEAFEVDIPVGCDRFLPCLADINDSAFHRFWFALIGDRTLFHIHSIPVLRSEPQYNWQPHMDSHGLDVLQRSFYQRWRAPATAVPIDSIRCDNPHVQSMLKTNDVLISGGAVSNIVTRTYLNHFVGIRYVIDYSMPDYQNICVFDRKSTKRITASYERDSYGTVTPRLDLGILTVMKNPYHRDRSLIAIMGIHGYGTVGCCKVLSEPTILAGLLRLAPLPLPDDGYQILVRHDVRNETPTLVESSLHRIRTTEHLYPSEELT